MVLCTSLYSGGGGWGFPIQLLILSSNPPYKPKHRSDLKNKDEIIQTSFSFGTACPQLNNICIPALYYATGQLFVSDFGQLSKSNVQRQNISKYRIHGIGYVQFLLRWAFF